MYRCPDAQIIAVCDVDADHLGAAKANVDGHYGQQLGKDYKGCAAYGDFRELINRKDIDAVGIATPDHWHVIPAIMAAKAGKDVIGEKPLSLTVAEGRILSDVMKQTGRIFQTASENRSIDVYIRLIELVRGGVVGKLKHIEVRLPIGNNNQRVGGNAKEQFNQVTPEEPPKSLNYEMWLGQAPWMPYIPGPRPRQLPLEPGLLRRRDYRLGRPHGRSGPMGPRHRAYGPGIGGGQGRFSAARRRPQHGRDVRGPLPVRRRRDDDPFGRRGDLDPKKHHDGPLVGRTSQPGIRFEGADGWIESHDWRGPLKASRRDMLDAAIDPEKVKIYRPSEIVDRNDGGKGGEHRNFLDCVKSRQPCYAPAETGHRTITIPHIGNIAMQLGRTLKWNPEAERFVDDAEADAMLSRKQREPWTIANIESWIKRNS